MNKSSLQREEKPFSPFPNPFFNVQNLWQGRGVPVPKDSIANYSEQGIIGKSPSG
jgi:hypothetical protein